MFRRLLPLVLVAWSVPCRAAVVWTATFEKGDLSEWSPGVNEKKGDRINAEASGEKFYGGSKAGKITVHPDDTFTFDQNRVDIQHPSTLTDEGKHMWLSGHYLLVEDAKVRNEIAFFESNVSYQNVMDFWVEPKNGGGTTINFGVGFLGENKLWTADFTAGVWHQLAIHVLWSADANKGLVDVWLDGTKVVTAQKAKTKADGNTLFFQTGLHRKNVAQFTETLFFDDFIEADTEAEAKVAAPHLDPPVGGGGGMGGVAASGSSSGGASAGSGGGPAAAGSSVGGMGGAPGAAGNGTTTAGVNGVAGAPTAGASAIAGSSSGNANDPENDSNCSLSVPKQNGSPMTSALLVALLVALLGVGARRRRARHRSRDERAL
jgi:hypothetical protein